MYVNVAPFTKYLSKKMYWQIRRPLPWMCVMLALLAVWIRYAEGSCYWQQCFIQFCFCVISAGFFVHKIHLFSTSVKLFHTAVMCRLVTFP